MYYNRKLKDEFANLLVPGGKLRWLFNFVRNHNELDFLIGRNKSKQWISIYRGLTRIISITPLGNKLINIKAADKYQNLVPNLYGRKTIDDNFQPDIENLIRQIETDRNFDRYFSNKKEGYYQSVLSREFGINGKISDEFLIIDKEVVIGYSDQGEKGELFGKLRGKYKQLQKDISLLNAKEYGKDLEKKSIGNELDFLALDKLGNILLIEYKHGTNTSGIYLSPLQIGLYFDTFMQFPRDKMESAILESLEQKQKIGLLNPAWPKPIAFKNIIPVLIISDYNHKSSAKRKFNEILNFVRSKQGSNFLDNLRTFNYTTKDGLLPW